MKPSLIFPLTSCLGALFLLPGLHLPGIEAKDASEILADNSMGQHGDGHGHHSHGTMAVPQGQPVPTVDLLIHPDKMGGWNLELQVENFRFAPENLDGESIISEGHAHLYLNGQKIARLYSLWYYLPELPAGRNELTVTLNTNNHEDLTYNGERIEATQIVEVE